MGIRTVAAVGIAVLLVPIATAWLLLRGSLAQLDGKLDSMPVSHSVAIERDALGVPTIRAASREDLAFATGFVHGQDRFFEMDLYRRLASGELAELVGVRGLEQDRQARLFGFRRVARLSLQEASPEQRSILEAYARGVNAGLNGLRSRPWEYWVLRSTPRPWAPEDTFLVTHSMWWQLQYRGFATERIRAAINSRLRGPDCAGGWKCGLQFLYPARTGWDAPLSSLDAPGATFSTPPVPGPDVLDVRSGAATAVGLRATSADAALRPMSADTGLQSMSAELPADSVPAIGSNNWAVAGRLTATGAALVANDMHLEARVPNVWYRVRLTIPAGRNEPGLDLNGLTLPGAPLLIAGSNGYVAWGFTNSYGSWSDLKPARCVAATDARTEVIHVQGGADVSLEVRWGSAGVVFAQEPDGKQCWFASWLAQVPAATNLNLMSLERATSVEQVLSLAPGIGIPHQNLVVGDRSGHIGWTIAGRIPTDEGPDRADGTSPFTTPQTHPRLLDPPGGRIWTANARVTGDPVAEAQIGGDRASVGAYYDLGARARQIHDDLLAIEAPATPADMLRIQLDDRAVFLSRWHDLLTELLDEQALAQHPRRVQLRRLVVTWDSRASVDSVGYRLVRDFRERTQVAVWTMILEALGLEPGAATPIPMQFEGPLWTLVTERPPHLLAASYATWRDFLLAQVDTTIDEAEAACGSLARCTWGRHHPVAIRHPLSSGLPFLARFLDMPVVELPGDHRMPRVQDGPIGASERFAVSPGHEDQGYIHFPGGQSGHPLSPYYRAGFEAWARGTPLPFLPGPAQHRLTLYTH
ncbi:MAG TPA: penicillin acylase family protein [Steroidobacteraceae bacterium]|nr:penicillin acylase family protein [Steroidobacteraceae bacterium]